MRRRNARRVPDPPDLPDLPDLPEEIGPPDLDALFGSGPPPPWDRPTLTELFQWPEDLILHRDGHDEWLLAEGDDGIFRFVWHGSTLDGRRRCFHDRETLDPASLDRLRRLVPIIEAGTGYAARVDWRVGQPPFGGWPRHPLH